MKKINQSGRSMIEMLGVLAIIGVLSVGGIAGYSKAMQKYRVNKTIDQISQISNGIHTLYSNRSNYEGLNIGVLGKAKVIPQELIGYSEFTSYQSSTFTYEVPVDEFNWHRNNPQPIRANYMTDNEFMQATLAWLLRLQAIRENPYETITSEELIPVTSQTFHGTNPFDGRILLSVDGDGKAFSINYLGLPEDACIEVLTQDWGTTDLIAVGVDSQITSTYGCTGDKGSHVCNNQLPVSVDKAMTLCGQQNDSKGVILKFR